MMAKIPNAALAEIITLILVVLKRICSHNQYYPTEDMSVN